MKSGIITLMLAFAIASCGTAAPSQSAAPNAATPREQLLYILDTEYSNEQSAAFRDFATRLGAESTGLLRDLALDSDAPALARANAVVRMGELRMRAFDVYSQTITDADARVRGATLGAIGPLAFDAPAAARPIFAIGLRDTVAAVQAKAIQELRDQDLDLLRDYVERTTHAELRGVALEMLRSAEAWGAPLEPEADGTLRRVAPNGMQFVLRPARSLPELEVVEGTLTVTTQDGVDRLTVDAVESAGGVIPAVADPMARYVAVETARRIEVHDLETGSVRVLGPGIAPRPLPLTPDFFYFRQIGRRPQRQGTTLLYEMVRASFEGGTPAVFDSVAVTAQPGRRGNMSPVRWARVRDRGTRFVVQTDGLEDHALPTPFPAAAQADD